MTTVSEIRIDERSEQPTLGIRTRAPFKGMFKVVDQLRKEMGTWILQHGIEPEGPPFLRYHVIDMAGEMDIEFGIPVKEVQPGDERVSAGVLPEGRYASLVYTGSGLTGNKTLIEWAKNNGITWDRWDGEKGDAFRARFESYLTDPKIEHRKTRWEIEVAIKLADD